MYYDGSLKWLFIRKEDQAFLQTYDLARPSPVRKIEKERQLADGRGGGGGATLNDAEKA